MTLTSLGAIASDILLIVGGLASLLAAISIVRLPDVYTRLHGAAKAGSLGVFTIMTAAGLHFQNQVTAIEALIVVAFLFLTAPIATHLVARGARAAQVPMILGDGPHDATSRTRGAGADTPIISPSEIGDPATDREPRG